MIKEKLIYLVQNHLGGGSAPSDVRKKYRLELVSDYIGMVFNDLIVRIYQNTGDINHLNSYIKTYSGCEIERSGGIGKPFINIPTVSSKKLLQLPHDLAVREVYANDEDDSVRCLYRSFGAGSVYDNLEVSHYLSPPRYEIIGERIYFNKLSSLVEDITVFMIVPWSEYEDDEDVPVAFENDQALFDEVINRLRQMPPEDKFIDGTLTQL